MFILLGLLSEAVRGVPRLYFLTVQRRVVVVEQEESNVCTFMYVGGYLLGRACV